MHPGRAPQAGWDRPRGLDVKGAWLGLSDTQPWCALLTPRISLVELKTPVMVHVLGMTVVRGGGVRRVYRGWCG